MNFKKICFELFKKLFTFAEEHRGAQECAP